MNIKRDCAGVSLERRWPHAFARPTDEGLETARPATPVRSALELVAAWPAKVDGASLLSVGWRLVRSLKKVTLEEHLR